MGNIAKQTAPPSAAGTTDGNQTRHESPAPRPQPPDSAKELEGFLDEKQLLARLPVSRRTIHNWRLAGKIPSIKIGRRVLFCWENVSQALLRLERGAE